MSASLDTLARKSVALFEAGDWAAFREIVAPDVCYEEPSTGRRVSGAGAVVDALAAWRAAFPDVTGEVVRLLTNGDTAVLEIVWHGTHNGPLAIPAGTVPPSGRQIDCWATVWQRWEFDRLTHERNHIDVWSLLAQIGAPPATA